MRGRWDADVIICIGEKAFSGMVLGMAIFRILCQLARAQ